LLKLLTTEIKQLSPGHSIVLCTFFIICICSAHIDFTGVTEARCFLKNQMQ
jgi:hypothetical protein